MPTTAEEFIVDKYVNNGTIDAADIFFLWNLTDQNFSVGKVLGQSIYGYADRFVYELLMLFWGNPSSEYFCDPTLKEPITNWTEVRNKGEEWAKQMLWIYLDKWRKWLDIPLNIQGGTGTAFTTIEVDDGNPDTPPVTITMTWTIQVYGITNTTNILLYDSTQRPKLQITTSASPDIVGPRTYYYDLIRESFVKKHQSYASGGPYFNTLKYVIDALTRAMKHKSDVYDDTQNKGLVDYAAYSIASNIGEITANYKRNPNDNYTILLNETHDLIYGQNEPYSYGISQLKNLVSSEQENWWREGAYKEYKYGNDADAYLYDLFRNTVSLWYEVVVNLYDGCTQWQLYDNPGYYGADCESWPSTNQQSVGIEGMGSPPQGSFKIHRNMVTDFYLRLKNYAYSIGQPIAVIGWPNVWEQCKIDSDHARDSTLGATPNGISYQLQQHGLRSGIDDKTDYNVFSTNFYNFVKDRVGSRFLGSGKLIENMSEWVEESFDVLWKNVEKNANFTAIPAFMTANTSRYIFWERFYDGAIKNRTLKNESIVVDFSPDTLGESNLSVDIVYPRRGHRFVDVQDLSYNMSMAPFLYDFVVNVSGNLSINLRTNRTSLLHGGMHTYTWYNDTISFNISLRIPLYTAWYIESGWKKYDVKFNYTRGYFGVDTKDSKTDPFFVSKYLNDAIFHYENIGEIKSRFMCFALPVTSVMKNEMASWNKTYASIILYGFNVTQNRMKNNDSVWSSLYNDVQSLTSNNYLQDFKFNYFGRDIEISSDKVRENTSYMKCIADINNHKFQGDYGEGNFSWKFNITKDNVTLIQNEFCDLWWHNTTIYRKNPTKYYSVSYSSVSGKKLNVYIEQLNKTCNVDFGMVSRKDLSKFKNAIPKNVSSDQEGVLFGLKKMVSNLYLNHTKNLNMPFGVFIKIENSTYTVWLESNYSANFLLWLNEIMRDLVYKVGSQEFPAIGYVMADMTETSYVLNNLSLNLTYLSSSVFGCFHSIGFWAEYHNYVILTNYRYGKSGNETAQPTGRAMGVDVSHWQGSIDWNQVRRRGYVFAFVKATEDTSYVDSQFDTNMRNGHAAGLYMGAYHFARPNAPIQDDAIAEADFFVNQISPYLTSGYLVPALDLEVGSDLGWGALTDWANTFLNRVYQRTGVKPIIYTSAYYARNLEPSITQWDLWIAHWTYDPNANPSTGVWSTWAFWQYSDQGSVPGISGNVDLDVFNGDVQELKSRYVIRSAIKVNIQKYDTNTFHQQEFSCSQPRKVDTEIPYTDNLNRIFLEWRRLSLWSNFPILRD